MMIANLEDTEAIKLAKYIYGKYLNYDKNTARRIISPIKLQKSLYFLFAYWGSFIRMNKENADSVEVNYSIYDENLFDDKIEAWTYGPVIPSVFSAEKNGVLEEAEKRNAFLRKGIIMEITEIIKNRVKLNEKLFSEEETKMILDNVEVFSRIYLLGLLDKK